MKKLIKLGFLVSIILLSNMKIYAQTNGYGQGQGRTGTVNENDYSTNDWDRFIYNYKFNTGVDYKEELGKPTTTDIVPRNEENENVRRDKNVSFNPPSYGVYSGQLDTERSNPYFEIENYLTPRDTTDYTMNTKIENRLDTANSSGVLQSTSLLNNQNTNTNSQTNVIETSSIPPQTTTIKYTQPTQDTTKNELNTTPQFYEDGTIGTISIPRFNVKVKVYEGESLANLAKGLAHFGFTSAWDGNVSIAGHNDKDFKNLKNLEQGDEIIYETKYGTRTYIMSTRDIIGETDYSTLGLTPDNRLTLITCVDGQEKDRYSIVALEKK